MTILLELFWVFFMLGLLGFGGGYAIIPLLQYEVVNRGWMTLYEFADIVAVTQISPGPMGANAAGYVGYAMAGPIGAVAAIIGLIAPSFILVLLVAHFFKKFYQASLTQSILHGVRPVTIGLIASAGYTFFMMSPFGDVRNVAASVAIFMVAGSLSFVKKINPVLIILISAILGILLL
ncbi:MAG: chromate transporter [Oscillospiraceae bacterium]|nr:chromate transporter [Oscillospiraceae bacterium]